MIKCDTNINKVRRTRVVRPREAGPNWRGLSHGELLDSVTVALKQAEFKPDEWRTDVARRGAFLAASVAVGWPEGEVPALGVLSSTDYRRPITVYSCLHVPGVESGVVVDSFRPLDEFGVSRPDLPQHADRLVAEWWARLKKHDDAVTALHTRPLTEAQVRKHLFDVMDQTGRRLAGDATLPPSRMAQVLARFRDGPTSAWGLLTAFGHVVLAKSSPQDQMVQMLAFYRLLAK